MALQVEYTIVQPNDCLSMTISDTTPDYDVVTSPGGYGAPNKTRASVSGTLFHVTPSGSTTITALQKTFLPTTSTTKTSILNTDLGVSSLATGCYTIKYEAYAGSTASGEIVAGTRYMVTSAGVNTATYNGVAYGEGTVFVGLSGITTYTESGTLDVSPLESSVENKLLYTCPLRACLIELYKNNLSNASIKNPIFPEKYIDTLTKLDIDFNSAIISFEENMVTLACDAILGIETECANFLNRCCE